MPGDNKTEQPTAKKLSDAFNKGQFARSQELQTLCVTGAGFLSLLSFGPMIWDDMTGIMRHFFGGFNSIDIRPDFMRQYATTSISSVMKMVAPVVGAAALGGIAAGFSQTRFKLTLGAGELDLNKLNPANGWKKLFPSINTVNLLGTSFSKIGVLGLAMYFEAQKAIQSPIFTSSMSIGDLVAFITQITMSMLYKFMIIMVFFAIIDYAYQIWKTNKDLMMTKEEVKDETKNSDVAPEVKSKQKEMRMKLMRRLMIQNVTDADVVLTNPTHFAVALKYDPKTMRAPKVIAKGQLLIAAKIKEMALKHQIPVIENKPLARSLYKTTQVNQEVPAALYAAIAEILAAVYRLNPYKYRHRATA